jgi:glycosyltransferase involved in cell wall biosynthesis
MTMADPMPGEKEPRVSVIMPVYNVRDYVREAVASIAAQTLTSWELIIVDDGSTDGTRAIVEALLDPRMVVLTQQNQGYPTAMNLGLARARGSYVARMDGDDVASPRRLEHQCAFLDAQPEFALVGTKRALLTPRGRHVPDERPPLPEPWSEVTWDQIYGGRKGFADPSAMFRREVALAVGGYRTYQRSGQDIDLWLRLTEAGHRAAVLHEQLYGFRVTIGAISDQPATSWRNAVPRLLAAERRERGSDAVMRGESLEPVENAARASAGQGWHVRDLWWKAAVCLRGRDYSSAWKFGVRAARAGGVGKETAAGMLRLLQGAR